MRSMIDHTLPADPAASAVGAKADAPVQVVSPSAAALRFSRFGDIVLGSFLLVVTAPLALLVALVVRLSSGSPVFFRQERMGFGSRTFTMVKFRTMKVGTELEMAQQRAVADVLDESHFKLDETDHRITRLGRFLRKTSLDELPQLWNVVRGDMSLVGVRPVEPAELWSRPLEAQRVYKALRPGLTGLWQIEGRSTTTPRERVELDRRYVETWSPWNDVKILVRTPLALLRIHHSK